MCLCVKLTRGQLYLPVFCQLDIGLKLSQRKELRLRRCLLEIQLQGIFSISDQGGKAPCGWDHLWTGSLGFYKRAG